MAEFRFECTETQYLNYYIEADTEEEARNLFANGEYGDADYTDTDNFELNDVTNMEEENRRYAQRHNALTLRHPTIKPINQ